MVWSNNLRNWKEKAKNDHWPYAKERFFCRSKVVAFKLFFSLHNNSQEEIRFYSSPYTYTRLHIFVYLYNYTFTYKYMSLYVCVHITDVHIHVPCVGVWSKSSTKQHSPLCVMFSWVFFVCLLFYVGYNLLYCFQAYIWVVISVWKTLL